MEMEKAIYQRRSVRNFISKEVEKEKLKQIAKAAIWSATAGNAQPWRFIVVSKAETLKLIKTVSPGLLGLPPAAIAVCADKKSNIEKMGPAGDLLAIMDCCMASQNMMLQAYNLGLGSCVIRSFNQKAVGEILNVPETISLELLVTIGYSAGESPAPPRDESVIRWEKFEEE